MGNRMRRLAAAAMLVAAMIVLATPALAGAAVTVTWERTWGSQGWGEGQFQVPQDIAADKWGNVYVAGGESNDNRVQMFDAQGEFVRSVGTTGTASAVLEKPRSIATDRWGNIYVGEKGNGNRVSVFFPELYGKSRTIDGSGQSAIDIPNNLAVGLDGTLYIAEDGTVVQRWTTGGDYLGTWNPLGGFALGLGVSQENEVFTTVDLNGPYAHHVITYDPLGNYQRMWGSLGSGTGQFNRPYDVGVDALGNSYVIESIGNRGQVFDPEGGYLSTFGSSGSGVDQFGGPYGLWAGADRTVCVANTLSNNVSKWNVEVATETTRLAGASRYLTAVEASKKAYPDGADTVVVATGANWPDALGGAALAGVAGGPLLLTASDTLPEAVSDEIVRLGATTCYILGGTSAVSDDVYDELDALMILHAPERLGGATRYETANLIAAEAVSLKGAQYDGTAFVVTGANFADALSVSPVAAANGWPIYLTSPATLATTVKDAMVGAGVTHGYVVGGEVAVTPAVMDALNDEFMTMPGVDMFSRVSGDTRYETSARFAQAAWDGMGMMFSRVALATGQNYPDALAGGVLQGSDYCPLLLTPSASLDPDVGALITDHTMEIYEMRYLGGQSALSTAVETAVGARLQ